MRTLSPNFPPVEERSPVLLGTSETRKPRVLVATSFHATPPETLDFAREIVTLANAELHLLRVTTPERQGGFHPSTDADPRENALASVVERNGLTLALGEGEFVPVVAGYALELKANLIIVSGDSHRGRLVSRLVHSSQRGVLVARRRLAGGAVLAATDLCDPRVPVVRYASELGRVAQTSVVAMHNVPPTRVTLDLEAGRVKRVEADTNTATQQLETLVEVTHALQIPTAVLTGLLDPVDAIVREARVRDASLVVVGRHVGLLAAKRHSVSADVVNLTTASVLVVPLG